MCRTFLSFLSTYMLPAMVQTDYYGGVHVAWLDGIGVLGTFLKSGLLMAEQCVVVYMALGWSVPASFGIYTLGQLLVGALLPFGFDLIFRPSICPQFWLYVVYPLHGWCALACLVATGG